MKRDKSIDIARGISMILVIAGHCKYIDSGLKIWLYSFHIPLFFFLSGMVFNYDKYKSVTDFLKNKIKKLMLPYFTIGILIIFLNNIYSSIIIKQFVVSSFLNSCLTNIKQLFISYRLHPDYYSFWFIPPLFVALIVFYVIIKKLNTNKRKTAILIVVAIISSIIQVFFFKYVKGFYYSLDLVPIALSFISFGYIYRSKINYLKKHIYSFDCLLILLFIHIVISFINFRLGRTDLFYCEMGNYFFFMIAALLGIMIVMIIANQINSSKILEYIGKNTFTFYFFHSIIVFPICDYIIWKALSIFNYELPANVMFLIYMIISCIILFVISFIINKYLPFLYWKGYRKKNEKK